jgi:hypothetical protein
MFCSFLLHDRGYERRKDLTMKRKAEHKVIRPDYPGYEEFHQNRRKFIGTLGLAGAALAAGGCRSRRTGGVMVQPEIEGLLVAPELPEGKKPVETKPGGPKPDNSCKQSGAAAEKNDKEVRLRGKPAAPKPPPEPRPLPGRQPSPKPPKPPDKEPLLRGDIPAPSLPPAKKPEPEDFELGGDIAVVELPPAKKPEPRLLAGKIRPPAPPPHKPRPKLRKDSPDVYDGSTLGIPVVPARPPKK